ncbi:MAG: ATP-binding response regulator, partial [Anaerolineae bacterium]
SLVEGHGLTLQIEIDADLPYVWVDQTRIRQVLLNLLNNAVRFTDNGGITVRARQQGENVVIAVSDTGVGIAPEDIPIIFEEFRQVDGSTRRQQGGAGLGLAISRQLVELHGGRIWVESQVGQGSTFYFSLPAHIGHPDAPHDCLLAPPPEDAEARRDDRSVLLAVTRSATAAAWLSRYVRGWRTIVVSDLPQGCEAARQMMPELVIIDHDCREEGSCRLEELAAQWGLPRATFIECPLPSAEVQRGLAVDGYLIKPVARESLWDVLRRFGQNVDKLLVVDDDQDSVLLLGRMLEDNPLRRYQVINAYNGQEAVMKVRDHRPDLVLLDLGLPDMDGFEVIRRFRAEKGGEKVPVVIVSAQDDMLSQQTFRGGVTITKADGLSAAEILERIQEVADKAVIRGRGLAVAKAGRAR